MDSHLATGNFFVPSQYGFRQARSTETALGRLWREVSDSVEEGKICLGVFLDLTAAFNCLQHPLFVRMLKQIGFEPMIVAWFESYLSARRQAIEAEDTMSEWIQLNRGTPQGSILGPYMFITYMNFILIEIASKIPSATIAYADDTTLLFRISPTSIRTDLMEALASAEKVVDIFSDYGLSVNSTKTNSTMF